MKPRDLPAFYNPDAVGTFFMPDLRLARNEGLAAGVCPASDDESPRRLLTLNDQIVAFTQEGKPMFVPGSPGDVRRIAEMIYQYPEAFHGVLIAGDAHPWNQHISFTSWWMDADGNPPPDFTTITSADVLAGKWAARYYPEWSQAYPGMLEAMNEKPLQVYPPHGQDGTEETALDPTLAMAVTWLCAARDIEPWKLRKGKIPYLEQYGMFRPCVRIPGLHGGDWNRELGLFIASFNWHLFTGQAENYCNRESLLQLDDLFREVRQLAAIRRTIILRDAMSLIPTETREEADAVLARFESDMGMSVSTTEEFMASLS